MDKNNSLMIKAVRMSIKSLEAIEHYCETGSFAELWLKVVSYF